MLIEYPEYYNRFRCIAGECPDTCCAGWEVDIDEDSYYYYQVVPGAFGERLRGAMAEEGEDKFFPLTDRNRCPFLNDANLCDIYSELGEESLCRVCTEYPRYYMEIGSYEQIDMSLSCTALGRLFFDESMPVIRYEQDEDDSVGEPLTPQEEGRLQRIRWQRDERIAILQNGLPSARGLQDRLSAAHLRMDETDDILLSVTAGFEILSQQCAQILTGIAADIHTLQAKETAFWQQYALSLERWFTKFAVYLTWRYTIDAWFDEDADDDIRVRRLISRSLRLLWLMCVQRWNENYGVFTVEDMIDLAHLFSKQVEHSDENVEMLKH